MKTMTPRERVITALNHHEPDRVPIDFGTGGNTGIAPEVWEKLCNTFDLDLKLRFVNHKMRLAVLDEPLLERLGVDTRPLGMRPPSRVRPCEEPDAFYDDWGVKWKEVDTGMGIYREIAEHPLDGKTIDDLEAYEWWPDPLDPARYEGLRTEAERLYNETGYAIVGCPIFNSVWEVAWSLRGLQSMLEDLILNPEFASALFERIHEINIASLELFLDIAGPYMQAIKLLGDDLGTQDSLLMSPQTYRALLKPYHKEMIDFARQRTQARIFMHTCGSIYRLLPDLIEIGVEILNPVQVSAKGMDTKRLKEEFGDRISFWGAVDTQHVLPRGAPDDVRREVEQRVADLGPGGGYILSSVHNVQPDVPIENFLAMCEHAQQVGRYPLGIALAE
jgi:uroporphyrinogen decarboxylase